MSYQWTDADLQFRGEVDDMLQDTAPEDLGRLAVDLEEGRTSLAPGLAGSVARELRRRAGSGLLFRPMPQARPVALDRRERDDDIPW